MRWELDGRRLHKLHRVLAAAALIFASGTAQGTKVKVRGTTKISANALRGRVVAAAPDAAPARPQRALFVRGTLDDDVGGHLAGQRVEITARTADGSKVRFGEGASATICDATRVGLSRLSPEAVVAVTDDAGGFCARLVLPAERYLVTLTSPGTPLLDAASADLAADLVRRSVAVRFDTPPKRLSLDLEEHTVVALATFEDEDDPSVPAKLLPLTLVTDREIVIATEVTEAAGRATFRVPTRALGEPGLGSLKLLFPGDDETGSASATTSIEKTARVSLALGSPIEAVESPEEGVPITVTLSSRGGSVPGGVVEARLGDTVVGAAPVASGRASFSASFSAPDRKEVSLSLRFTPDAPWWEAPEGLGVTIPLVESSPWRRAPLVAAALAVALFIAVGRLGRVRTEPKAPKSQRGARSVAAPGIAVVEITKDPRQGLRGRVLDAHERTPVGGARLTIETHDFTGTQVIASSFADAEGAFELPPTRPGSRAELVVDAPHHSSLRRPLPPPSVIEVAMVSRRRALLDRLVEWARVRGRPFDAKPEPTPHHVQRVASPGSAPARWAEAVEQAAFGPEAVDGRVEGEVEALKPQEVAIAKLPVGQTKEA